MPFCWFLHCLYVCILLHQKQWFHCVSRCIISHDVKDVCKRKIKANRDEKRSLQNGKISANLFKKICEYHGKDDELIKNYLLKFQLAVKIDDDELFIPSLVSGKVSLSVSKAEFHICLFQGKNISESLSEKQHFSHEVLVRFCNTIAVGAFEKVLITLMQKKEKVIIDQILCQKIGKHI